MDNPVCKRCGEAEKHINHYESHTASWKSRYSAKKDNYNISVDWDTILLLIPLLQLPKTLLEGLNYSKFMVFFTVEALWHNIWSMDMLMNTMEKPQNGPIG